MNEGKINLEHDKKNKLIQNVRFAIQEMPKKERVQGITEILSESFSEEEKKVLGRSLRIHNPPEKTKDFVWKVTIGTFAFVLCGSFIVLSIGVFKTVPENSSSLVSGDLLLSIFTAAVGFFAGIFAPSPGKSD